MLCSFPAIKVLPFASVMSGERPSAMDSIRSQCWPWKLPVSAGRSFCAVRRKLFENQTRTRTTTGAGQFANYLSGKKIWRTGL
jgi:hypothetical protein